MDHPDTSSNTSSKQVRLLPTLGLVGALFCSPRGWGTSSGATGSPAGGARSPHPGHRGADRLGRRGAPLCGVGVERHRARPLRHLHGLDFRLALVVA